MHKNWTHITNELSDLFHEVRSGIPDVARGFSAQALEAYDQLASART